MAGQLRVDEITNEAGTGSPSFPFGVQAAYGAGGTPPVPGSFTDVPSTVLEVGDPIRSSDIIAIKDNTLFLFGAAYSFPILNFQKFEASATWTKPSISNPEVASIVVVLVGGGGGGAAVNTNTQNPTGSAGGGGSGGVVISSYPLANAPSTGSIVIGAGGGTRTAQNNSSSDAFAQALGGIQGGASTFTLNSDVLTSSGGGGGFAFISPFLIPEGGGPGGSSNRTGLWTTPINLSKNGRFVTTNGTVFSAPVFSGGGSNAHSGATQFGQNRSGGPAFSNSVTTSPFMGAGGNGDAATGTNGTAWGAGGGGVSRNSVGAITSGAGASGGALVFVVRGFPSNTVFNDRYTQIP